MKTISTLVMAAWASTALAGAEPEASRRPITIRAIEGLQFEPARAEMEPGQTVLFRFLNRDPSDQPHNLVIIEPGTLEAIQKASMELSSDSAERGYIPDHEAILKHTKLLEGDRSEEFRFTAPKEPGIYPYVCTYPGHAMIMYGALYVGVKPGKIENDENIPRFARDAAKRLAESKTEVVRPAVTRFFMEGAGPAAIAVALENDLNYCWDAGNCRLRYAWRGKFVNLGDTSRSNGSRQAKMSGKEFWNGGGDELTYAIQLEDPKVKPDFHGYRLIDGKPEFKYDMGELQVTEFITSTSTGLLVGMKIANATAPVKVYAKGNITSNVGSREGDYIIVAPADAAGLELTIPAK
ncbi:MAG: plastocyanin/azurin family copper-binding protein [Luteolibacter sp.]